MWQNVLNNNKIKSIIYLGIIILSSGMIYVMQFFSTIPVLYMFFRQEKIWIFVNVLFLASGLVFLQALVGKLWVSIIISSILSTIWSIANYYTVLYHGSPLFFSEYANFKTAMEVAGTYSFSISSDVIKIICVFIALIVLALVTKVIEGKYGRISHKKTKKQRLLRFITRAIVFVASVMIAIGLLDVGPKRTMAWSWRAGVEKYGIVICSLSDAVERLSSTYRMPEGYSLEVLPSKNSVEAVMPAELPDIIVILNETFYDIEEFYEINPDASLLQKFYSIDNAVFGYAPSGGGTNDTEYELLLSNSLALLNGTSPYNFVKLADRFSCVKYMEKLGYITTAMHCGQKENYHRNTAYRELEFDNIYLGEDDFNYKNKNYNRGWLDSDNYKDMLDRLDENTSAPQFMFLLTYQNHGGYTQNDDALDTVHSGVDYGETTSALNEFMSSLILSSEAFYDLTEELKGRKPTVVVMVGDHGPNFLGDLTPKRSDGGYEPELARSLVPYVIWSNYKEIPEEYGNLASIEDLIPMTLEVAGLPLSTYYSTILKVHDTIPLRTSKGMYIDADGNTGVYSSDSEYGDLLNEYYYLEYNSLGKKDEVRMELFLP